MNIGKVVTKLGLTNSTELLQEQWESSKHSKPPKRLFFLSPEFIVDACQAIPLPAEVAQAAIAVSQRIATDAALQALAWHYHYCLFCCRNYPENNIDRWPFLTGILQDDAGMFYVLVLLSGLPEMQALHRARSIPPKVTHDTLFQVRFAILNTYRRKHGNWGLTPHNIMWFMNHFKGKLFQFGRLQFQFGSFGYRLRAFRHQTSGIVVALSENGVRYTADGQVEGPGRIHSHNTGDVWTSQLVLTDDKITGYPILPTGCTLRQKVCISTTEWRQVLAPGDPVLNIHIPPGGSMGYDLCGQSFRAALKFFPQYFSNKPFVSFCCASWLFDNQLEELLPATSNIARFQREVYLFPFFSDDLHLLKVVFGHVPEDLSKVPRDTTLQRALLDRLIAGGQLCAKAGGCFLLPDDFNWGIQVYRRQKFPW